MGVTETLLVTILAAVLVAAGPWIIRRVRNRTDTARIVAFLPEPGSDTAYRFRSTHAIAAQLNMPEARVKMLAADSPLIKRNEKEKQSWRLA